jgi:hypothetical protein
MNELLLRPRTLGFTIVTRVVLGVGVGLLVSDRLDDSPRRRLGAALVALGAITTVPLAIALRRSRRPSGSKGARPGTRIGAAVGRRLRESRSLA